MIFEVTSSSRSFAVVRPRRFASASRSRSLIFNSSCRLRATITVSCARLICVSVSMLRSLRVIFTPLTTASTLSSGFCSQPQFGGAWKRVVHRKSARMDQRSARMKSTDLSFQYVNSFAGVVGQDDVGAGAFDAREGFHHYALFVDPAFLCGGLDQR